MDQSGLVAIQFYDPDVGYENLWAVSQGNDCYQLKSIPFFVYGVAVNDVVRATAQSDGRLQYTNTVRYSGNRTLRARSEGFLNDPSSRKLVEENLELMGCQVEVLRNRLIAIDVPQVVELETVTGYLTERRLSWEYGHPDELNKQG